MVDDDRVEELHRTQRVMAVIRLCAIPFSLVQILTFYIPYPPGVREMALLAPLALLVGTPAIWLGSRRSTSLQALRRWSLAGLLLDGAVAMLLVVTYTFDPDTAVWALLYLIPVEGALLFQLRGAIGTMAAVTAAYVLREVYGAVVHGVDFLLVSVTFRMGLGFMMATALGVTCRRLVDERDRAREMARLVERHGSDLEQATEVLRIAQRAQLEFVAVTNHELRTPLTAIKGFAGTLRHRWEDMDDATRLAAIDAIDQQSRRLGEMVEDVLMVASMHAGSIAVSPRPLRLCDALEEAVEMAGVQGSVTCPGDVMVQADQVRLQQVLVNLLTNARKYGRPPVEVTGWVEEGRTRISVRDHGPGVAPDFQERMYEEFTQASVGPARTAEGYGLGLAIVYYLVGALGGTITYRDHPGGGAVFEVDLPSGPGCGEDAGARPAVAGTAAVAGSAASAGTAAVAGSAASAGSAAVAGSPAAADLRVEFGADDLTTPPLPVAEARS